LIALLKQCLAARRRKRIRDLSLALLLLICLFVVIYSENPWSIVPFWLIAWGITFAEIWISYHKVIAKYFSKEHFDPDAISYLCNRKIGEKLEKIANVKDGNVIVYSGFSPFIGSGFDIGGWSFALNISKGKKEVGETLEPLPFQVIELYDYLNDSLGSLHLDGMNIEEKLFMNGKDIRNDKRFLADPCGCPYTKVDPKLIKLFIDNSTQIIRHYKCIQVIDWKGELIVSIFIRLLKLNRNLFVEAIYFLLTPLGNTIIQSIRLT
jgi:hypothetical protein